MVIISKFTKIGLCKESNLALLQLCDQPIDPGEGSWLGTDQHCACRCEWHIHGILYCSANVSSFEGFESDDPIGRVHHRCSLWIYSSRWRWGLGAYSVTILPGHSHLFCHDFHFLHIFPWGCLRINPRLNLRHVNRIWDEKQRTELKGQ